MARTIRTVSNAAPTPDIQGHLENVGAKSRSGSTETTTYCNIISKNQKTRK
jgi:hypothetical protein